MVDTTISNYKLISLIGEGGMGKVYLATDLLKRKLAIKILDPILTKNTEYIERFIREAKTLATLDHPGIVKVHNFYEQGGSYHMVMEFVEGETLKSLLQKTGPIPEDRAIKILMNIADALCFAHINGIIHRDIKPENIMIDKYDNIKILDFGIAKLLNDYSLTRTGTKMGTIYYMSPEQIKAEKDIDSRTDIYSLGIIFYEMLTGKLPFNVNTESDFMVMKEIIEGELEDPRVYYPHIDERVCNLLHRMIQKDRNKRMGSLDEVISFDMSESNNHSGRSITANHITYYCLNCNKEVMGENELCNDCKRTVTFENEMPKLTYNDKTTNLTSVELTVTDTSMFKSPFSGKGRIRRMEYGLSVILFNGVYFVLNLVLQGSKNADSSAVILLLIYIPSYWFLFAQGAKRCHDMNKSGWMQIIPFYIFVMIFADGDIGYNDYGPNPKGLTH